MFPGSLQLFPDSLPLPVYMMINGSLLALAALLSVFYAQEYHTRITRFFIMKTENTFMRALILCLLNSMPKIVLLASLHSASSLSIFSSVLSGSTQLSVAITLAIVLLSAKSNFVVHHMSFYKDIFFMEASHLLLLIMLSNASASSFIPFMSLCVFAIFLTNTITIPSYISQVPSNSVSSRTFALDDIPHTTGRALTYPLRLVFDALLLNHSYMPHEVAKKKPYAAIFSPTINMMIVLSYFGMHFEYTTILALMICALLFGSLLYTFVKKRIMSNALYVYSFAAATALFSVIMVGTSSMIKNIAEVSGVGSQLLSGTLLSMLANIVEIVTCMHYARSSMPEMASCSVMYSPVFNSLLFLPLIKIALGRDTLYAGIQNIANAPFVYFSYVFILAEIKVLFVNYLLRHQKLTKDLGYTLIVVYLLFIAGFAVEGKTHLCK
ncbi:hypothetical protein OCOL_001706 [Ordospora colligata]|uniref:Sodium/calcium exchanger membrane region domain-containing protein n=1 Tax=Ordospora colligata OC4 TaxID=1354746 RepID=A0A0B2UIU3_9MICR|nr:uncharacterized protein M896_090800 [Ordospora colligata OC4]KHN69154.1 hypothetical protein M896_090800 [Ordospora colligata OC4]